MYRQDAMDLYSEKDMKEKTLNSNMKPFDMISPLTDIDKVILYGRNIVHAYTMLHGGKKNYITVGYATTFGLSCIVTGNVEIGSYCQFGSHISVHSSDHPITYGTTYINERLFGGIARSGCNDKKVIIGNDVWIGDQTNILKGVSIGNGAIIGAGAVVTKDIPAYGIAVGNPAKVTKKRFDDKIIDFFNILRWWELSFEDLEKIENMKELFSFDLATDIPRALSLLKLCIKQKFALLQQGDIKRVTPIFRLDRNG